jgi:hypothetical protein
MAGKIPPSAFDFYAGLGSTRSYAAIAKEYGVSKRAVFKRARNENWKRRLEEIEIKARDVAEKRTVETVAQMNERHLRAMRIVQGKALEALKQLSLESAMDAVRALDLATKQERLIRGEPIERTAVSIEETVRREYANWLVMPATANAAPAIGVKEVKAHAARRDGDERNAAGQRLLSRDARDVADSATERGARAASVPEQVPVVR